MAGRDAHVQLIICRHTQTDDNVGHRYSGQNDIELNEVGIEQAERLARRIANEFPTVHHVLSSDLLRAHAVAEVISREYHASKMMTPALRETHLGRATGLTKQEAIVLFPNQKYRTGGTMYDYHDIGGESADDVVSRSLRAIDEEAFRITRLHEHQRMTLVIVGHGTALRTVFVDRLRLFRKLHEQGDFQVCNWLIGQL